ncbi:MAG TPA: CPBP family intramembrane glutamic endopeptidase [Flavisolibacter sp.]
MKGISFTGGFFIMLGLALFGLVLSGMISGVVLLAGTSPDGETMKEAMRDPSNAGTMRALQALSVFLSMFVPAVITAYIVSRKPFRLLGFRNDATWKQAGLVLLVVIISVFIAGALTWLNRQVPLSPDLKEKFEQLEMTYLEQVELMVDFSSVGGYLMSIVILALLPAIFEEVLFRGGLQNFLARATKRPWVAILVVSVLFSLVHFSFFGFLPRVFLGIMLGMIYYATGNLWLAILAHFINNLMAITQAYIISQQGRSIREVMMEEMPTSYWGFLALPLLYLLYVALRRTATRTQEEPLHDFPQKEEHAV